MKEFFDKVIEIAMPPQNIINTPLVHKYGVCERTDMGIFAEPLNVASSAGFFIVALMLFKYYLTNKEITSNWIIDIHALGGLVLLIGSASVVFHMVPSYYTELADIIFIVLFINVFFFSFMIRIAGISGIQIFVVYLAFIGSTYMLVSQFPNAMNDSIGYLSSMLTLVFIAFYLNLRNRPTARSYLVAAIIGMMSLFFRVIDNEVCEDFAYGTHFMWHIFNAILIYILLKQLIRSVNRRARMLRMAAEHGV
jgi:hypothetical protein